MKIKEKKPSRLFSVGLNNDIEIKDCGELSLLPDEQVTLTTESGQEYDICRKEWGFYATPSTNGRLKSFGFKTALVKNSFGKKYIMIVDEKRLDQFNIYLEAEMLSVLSWLDEEDSQIN